MTKINIYNEYLETLEKTFFIENIKMCEELIIKFDENSLLSLKKVNSINLNNIQNRNLLEQFYFTNQFKDAYEKAKIQLEPYTINDKLRDEEVERNRIAEINRLENIKVENERLRLKKIQEEDDRKRNDELRKKKIEFEEQEKLKRQRQEEQARLERLREEERIKQEIEKERIRKINEEIEKNKRITSYVSLFYSLTLICSVLLLLYIDYHSEGFFTMIFVGIIFSVIASILYFVITNNMLRVVISIALLIGIPIVYNTAKNEGLFNKTNNSTQNNMYASTELNIRIEPNKNSQVIISIPYNSQVTVMSTGHFDDRGTEWYYVNYSGYNGYCNATYLLKK